MAKLSGILGTLAGMEETASRIYWKAGAAVVEDRALEGLLRCLAMEEEEHMRLFFALGRHIRSTESLSALDINEEAVKNASDYFCLAEKRLDAGKLTNQGLVDCMATTESSEWNREFLKVINALKEDSRFFIPVAAKIQQHKRSVERFLAARTGYSRLQSNMKSLPSVWEEKLLVVDDDEDVSKVVTAVLEDEGSIETAGNGAEALRKIEAGYYAAIVSDYKMPLMNGKELLNRAEQRFPGISARFLFFSSDPVGVDYFRSRGVRALMKPSGAMELANEVAMILGKPY